MWNRSIFDVDVDESTGLINRENSTRNRRWIIDHVRTDTFRRRSDVYSTLKKIPYRLMGLLTLNRRRLKSTTNRVWDKTGFGMYNLQNVEKGDFGQPVCVCVCVSVLLYPFPQSLTGVRVNRSSWNFRCMFGNIGHCDVSIFVAIRQPVYMII